MQLSESARNAMLEAIETSLGASPILRIYTGAKPAGLGDAATGTLLSEMTLPADAFAAAAGGSKAKAGTWQDAGANAQGLAGWWRMLTSGATAVLQGLCSQPWAASSAYVVGQQVNNGGRVYRATAAGTSAGSGGPTGTGSGIVDGGVTWEYVGPVDLVLQNTSLALDQVVTVSTFTVTAPGA